MELVELWTNSSSLNATTVTDSRCADYDVFLVRVLYRNNTANQPNVNTEIVFNGQTVMLNCMNVNYNTRREFSVDDTGFSFGSGYYDDNSTSPAWCLPVGVYGIKDLEVT